MASATATTRPMVLPGHSGPLRYANAEDLPSYPSPGLRPGDAAASAAATLGWAASPPPAAASPPGTPRSPDARLAAGWAQRHLKPQPQVPSPWVSTAANLAFRASKTPPPVSESVGFSRQNSMHAAKGAMAVSRPRSRSSPQTPSEAQSRPDQSKTGVAALTAATIAHNNTSPVHAGAVSPGEAGAVPYTTMDRRMFTSNPPVKPEADEKLHADVLHASALAMAKKMYDQQQKMIDRSARAHARSSSFSGPGRRSLSGPRGEEGTPVVFNSLQEAAYRQAQERLAKLQDEHERQRDLQEYYGSAARPQRSKFGTIKGKLTRRRSSSDGDLLDDQRRSEQIRNQMSLLRNKLTEVDEDKRTRDREALLAAAQRNVKAQLHEMDAKMQSDAGRLPQTATDDWGRKALVAAQARFAAGGHEEANKVDIGGGKLMDRSEVEVIAAKRLQPLLDEINDRAEKEKERREEEWIAQERRKEEAERDRMRDKEVQEIHKKLKEQQKEAERAKKAEIKQEEKARKEEERAAKAEQKRAAREEKHKANETPQHATAAEGQAEGDAANPPSEPENGRLASAVGRVRALSINFPKRPPRQKGKEPADVPQSVDDTAVSPPRKVRNWLLSRFPRPRARSASAVSAEDQEPDSGAKKGFIGGVALARLRGRDENKPGGGGGSREEKGVGREQSDAMPHDSSMREVALAGRPGAEAEAEAGGGDELGKSSKATVPAVAATGPPSTPPQRPASRASRASRTSQEPSIPASASARQQSVSSLGSEGGSPRSSMISGEEGDGGEGQGQRGGREREEERDEEEEVGEGAGEEGEKFVDARSEPETASASGSASVSASASSKNIATPPTVRRLVGGGAATGRASPFRESRFSEILE